VDRGLHAAGVHDIQTCSHAAEAPGPLAGELTFVFFSLGIIGTGLLAVPVLAGSAAYTVAEAAGWHGSLSLRLDQGQGRGFYGVIAVPIMAVMMLLATRRATMGENVIGNKLTALGWVATAAMAATVVALLATL
jgi:Mn2+/Fe2+ NRAMP family transporter